VRSPPKGRVGTSRLRSQAPIGFNLLLQFIQVLQSCQHNLLACFFNLTGQEHLVKNCIDLVKVKDQVQLAHVAEESIQDLNKEVDRLEIGQLVVVCVDSCAEEQAGVPPVNNLEVAVLDEVGLALLVTRRD